MELKKFERSVTKNRKFSVCVAMGTNRKFTKIMVGEFQGFHNSERAYALFSYPKPVKNGKCCVVATNGSLVCSTIKEHMKDIETFSLPVSNVLSITEL